MSIAPVQSPIANADMVSTAENAAVDINVLANDFSGSGGTLTLTGVTQGAHGAVTITPTPNFAVEVSSGQEINAGSVLAYDKNQAWTVMTSLDVGADRPSRRSFFPT